jgi:glycosyltransferase involved in cell wall biosynthesis
VLAGDTAPTRELIADGRTGLLAPLFDADTQADAALRVLRDPAAHRPLGEAARRTVEERHGLAVAIPALKAFFERAAARRPAAVPDSPTPRAVTL